MTIIPEDGGAYIPKRVGWGAIFAVVLFIVTQIVIYVQSTAATSAELAALQRNDIEARARGDDIRRRLQDLENQRDRITRVEEQLKISVEMLREIRETLRKKA
jgi:hypothetical protein